MSKTETFKFGETQVVIDPHNLVFTDQTLSKYIEKEGGWFDHFGAMLALAEKYLGLLEAKYEKIFGERFSEFKDAGASDKLAEAKAKGDDELFEVKKQIVEGKYRVSRLKSHLKAWDKNHDNAQSMGHMQRKQMDKLNTSIMGQAAGVNISEIMTDMAAERMVERQEESGSGQMEEGTSLSALTFG